MRFELMTSALSEQRSNQLNYLSKNAEHNLRRRGLPLEFPNLRIGWWTAAAATSLL